MLLVLARSRPSSQTAAAASLAPALHPDSALELGCPCVHVCPFSSVYFLTFLPFEILFILKS